MIESRPVKAVLAFLNEYNQINLVLSILLDIPIILFFHEDYYVSNLMRNFGQEAMDDMLTIGLDKGK